MTPLARTSALAIALLCLPTAPQAADPKNNNSRFSSTLLSAEVKDADYNKTLASPYLKHQVLKLADVLANAGLLASTGYVRDHKKKKYVFISYPPVDLRVAVKQSHKIRRMGQALRQTHDDDYKLAGDRMIALADCIAGEDAPGAKRQLLLLEEFYSRDLEKPSQESAKDEGQLNAIAQEVVGGVKDVLGQFASDIQSKALEGLNLQSILGGVGNVF